MFVLATENLEHGIQPRDIFQDLLGDARNPAHHFQLRFAHFFALIRSFQSGGRESDTADLRQHRGDLDVPTLGNVQRRGQRSGRLAEAAGPAERQGARQAEHVGQCLNTAAQSLLQQLTLRRDQAMLFHGSF